MASEPVTTGRVGIDLGGTKIFGALVDLSVHGVDSIEETAKRPTPTDGAEAIIDAVAEVVAELTDDPRSVGIGTPGVVAPGSGTVVVAPNLAGFDRPVELGPRLAERLGCPVAVGNDVNVAALGEARAGAVEGATDVLAVWMGTGLGGALLLDGRLRVGPLGRAGEIGHVVVVPGGRVCGCGGLGHLEAYIGRRSLELEARARHGHGRSSLLVELAGDDRMKSKVFRTAYDADDEVTHELLDEGLALLATVIANVVLTVDIDTVVLGGGLGERFADEVVDHLAGALSNRRLAGDPPEIRPAELGDLAGALGAAHLGMEPA